MRSIGFALAALLGLAGLSYSGAHYPEPCLVSGETGSVLCSGLIEHFELGEASDSPRFGAGMAFLQEAPGQDVAKDAGSQSVDFSASANVWLWANITPPTDAFSITFRVKVKTLGSSGDKKYIFSWADGNGTFAGPEVYWENNGGQGRVCFAVQEAETNTPTRTVCQNGSANTWYFVTIGASPYIDGKSNIFISLNNVARTTTAVTYWHHGGWPYLRIGGRPNAGPSSANANVVGLFPLDGYLSELDLFSRPISEYEQTLLYNGGGSPTNALAFPYDTN